MPSSRFWVLRCPIRSKAATSSKSKPVKIRKITNQSGVHQLVYEGFPEPFDVHGVPAGEVAQPPPDLVRARRVRDRRP